MAFIKTYNKVLNGYIIATGNTVGLSDGVSGIGVFTTLDTSKQVAGYPAGTTINYLENSSSAYLNIPLGSTVEYAILTWGGTIGTNTIVSGSCQLTTPASTIPNTITANFAYYGAPGSISMGSNSADVTSLVSAGGSGLYIFSKGYATLGGSAGSLGWMLNVVISSQSYTRKLIDINVGIVEIPMGTTATTTITGLVTPKSGAVTGRYLTMGYDGENTNSNNFNGGLGVFTLTGPNNTATGFYNHQINNCDTLSPNVGQLDTTGSFGTYNSSSVVKGTRYGTDITNVSLNGKIGNNITLVTLVNNAYGEGIAVSVNAFQIDNQGFDDPIKTVDKPYADVGDTITYTIPIINTGTLPYSNVVLIDTIPTNTTFIANSLTINGVSNPGNPAPPTGINLGTIAFGGITTVTFKVLTTSTIPSPNVVKNNASSTFVYNGLPVGINSNTVSTTILNAILSSSKIAKTYANIGDIITYTIPMKNTGNTTAINIKFIDTIPNGTTFVANSLRQDTTVLTGLSPTPPGATLPNAIKGGNTSTVTFQVRVTALPSPNPIPNYASMTFSYTINNSTIPNVVGSGSSSTNLANTFINRADLTNTTKIVDKDFATLNDVITYTITIPNTGTTSANAVIFKDTIPTGTTFVANSFTVNGVVKTGVSPAPPGINIGTIPAGGIFTVTFKVTVNTIPSPNRVLNSSNTTFNYQVDPSVVTTTAGSANSNIVTTTITRTALILPTKAVDLPGAFIGDTITYTIVLKNTGTTTASNIFFTDTTPNGTIFVPNSVKVNGTTISGGTLSPPPGVSIPNLGVN
ncbi:beta strand repeat-containing protein, partial [Romboutsia sp.]|uniref:beta strand repeat-containing protein n=1 Tax=Romboutsia sp. TaxID=1965302 RepID=UPI003F3E0456